MVNLTISEKSDLVEVYDCLLTQNSFEIFGMKIYDFIKKMNFLRK